MAAQEVAPAEAMAGIRPVSFLAAAAVRNPPQVQREEALAVRPGMDRREDSEVCTVAVAVAGTSVVAVVAFRFKSVVVAAAVPGIAVAREFRVAPPHKAAELLVVFQVKVPALGPVQAAPSLSPGPTPPHAPSTALPSPTAHPSLHTKRRPCHTIKAASRKHAPAPTVRSRAHTRTVHVQLMPLPTALSMVLR